MNKYVVKKNGGRMLSSFTPALLHADKPKLIKLSVWKLLHLGHSWLPSFWGGEKKTYCLHL